MDQLFDFGTLSTPERIAVVLVIAFAAHLLVRSIQLVGERLVSPHSGRHVHTDVMRRYPKVATVAVLTVSALTFAIYFAAIGTILTEFGVAWRDYLASASVIGLAVGFSLQGLGRTS